MKKVLFIIAPFILVSCKNDNMQISKGQEVKISSKLRTIPVVGQDEVYAPSVPPEKGNHCIYGPDFCQDLTVYSASFSQFNVFVEYVKADNYITWLQDSSNLEYLVELSPEYAGLYGECITGTKKIIYYSHSEENTEAALLIGDTATVSLLNHDASIIFEK